MKKNLLLLAFMLQLVFAVSVRAASTSSLTFANLYPSIADGTESYQQKATVSSDLDATSIVYSLGTIVGVTADIDAATGKLSNINGNGAIQVKATCGDLSADYVLTVAYATHTWNFCSNVLTLTPNGRLGEKPKEIGDANVENDQKNRDATVWELSYMKTSSEGIQSEPVFTFCKKVNGDNALIINPHCAASSFGRLNSLSF